MKILLTFFVLLFSSSLFAEDISDFQIEGISIGDSLLDYMSEKEIKTEIELNKHSYNYLTDEFGEVYLFGKFEIYDRLSFFVKPKDKFYTIYSIKGSISYDEKLEQCFAKQKEIEIELSSNYKDTEKITREQEFPFDSTGESITFNTFFVFDSGDYFRVSCTKYKKSLKIKYNWADSLQVIISLNEIDNWFSNPI